MIRLQSPVSRTSAKPLIQNPRLLSAKYYARWFVKFNTAKKYKEIGRRGGSETQFPTSKTRFRQVMQSPESNRKTPTYFRDMFTKNKAVNGLGNEIKDESDEFRR